MVADSDDDACFVFTSQNVDDARPCKRRAKQPPTCVDASSIQPSSTTYAALSDDETFNFQLQTEDIPHKTPSRAASGKRNAKQAKHNAFDSVTESATAASKQAAKPTRSKKPAKASKRIASTTRMPNPGAQDTVCLHIDMDDATIRREKQKHSCHNNRLEDDSELISKTLDVCIDDTSSEDGVLYGKHASQSSSPSRPSIPAQAQSVRRSGAPQAGTSHNTPEEQPTTIVDEPTEDAVSTRRCVPARSCAAALKRAFEHEAVCSNGDLHNTLLKASEDVAKCEMWWDDLRESHSTVLSTMRNAMTQEMRAMHNRTATLMERMRQTFDEQTHANGALALHASTRSVASIEHVLASLDTHRMQTIDRCGDVEPPMLRWAMIGSGRVRV